MTTTREVIERVLVSTGSTLTVCDPCYLIEHSDGESRLAYGHTEALPGHGIFALSAYTEKPLRSGTWEAYAEIIDDGDMWGERVKRSGLRAISQPEGERTVTIEEQGVDAGMVGHFVNRPRMTYEDAYDGNMTRLIQKGHTFAWVTDSGYGDGAYPVRAVWVNGEIVEVEAIFFVDDDFDSDEWEDGQ